MEKQVIEKFLKNNPLDEIFHHQISLGTLMINANGIDFSIDIDNIKAIGLNYMNIFFETKLGRFEFKRAEKLNLLRKAFGEGVK
jgi:hypothetical protein